MGKGVRLGEDRILWMERGREVRPVFRTSTLFVLAAFLFVLIGSALIYVWSRIQVIRAGYEISDAVKAGRGLVEESRRLRVEVASLKSYDRIEKIAIEDLGLSKPRPDQVILIR